MDIAYASLSTTRNLDLLILLCQIAQGPRFISHHGSEGNVDDQICASAAMALCLSPVAPTLGSEPCFLEKPTQISHGPGAPEENVPSAPAISPIRTTQRNELFTAKTRQPVPTIAPLDCNLRLVGEIPVSVRHNLCPHLVDTSAR
jgi:hypothetical protein